MFEIRRAQDGSVVLSGRLDAVQAPQVREVLEGVEESVVVDLGELQYVSSAGLGILIATQRRLADRGARLTLRSPTPHVRELLRITGLDGIFAIE